MLTVTYKERTQLDKYCCIDHIKKNKCYRKSVYRRRFNLFQKRSI